MILQLFHLIMVRAEKCFTLIAKLKTFLSAPESARDPQERLSSGPLPRSLNASMILGQLDTSGEKSGEKTWMERLML